ncbi:d-amino-acid dehydrogenase [Janibacter sp. HTCC2649]|uniref:NAD(P)/FAD-dependent oxidoreductase n=1 Tax=Janibacter sp. HTCC2649 TaxID=313589 RepID=UPI00006719A7|nr:FAD-dependent oxidoreductase [Janibacter sp. HTCC2649]EAP97980.1 d-amino-acid dehydrogenase [Janibacter sp. HTCC2649]
MAQQPEHVVIVGAGMVGLSTAWYLQEAGVSVTVLDRDGVAAGSSWGNAGWLAPALTLPLPEPAMLRTGILATLKPDSPVYVPLRANPRLAQFLAGFARHCTADHWNKAIEVFNVANAGALAAYDELTEHEGLGRVDEPTLDAEPFLAGFVSEADRSVLVEEFRHVAQTGGLTSFELLDGDDLHTLAPSLGEAVTHGVRLHRQRYLNPGRFVHALAEAVTARGGEIVSGHRVTNVSQRDERVLVEVRGGESIVADAAVLANGSWIGDLARPHGVRKVVQAGRGYSFTVHPDQVPTGPVYFPTQRVACTPLGKPDEGLRIAGMMEFRNPDDALDPRRVKAIVDAATPMFTGIDWSQREDEWVGSRPCTTDGLPLVGASRSDRVFVAGGHGMWGVALGPLTGKLLAAQMTGTATSGDRDLLTAFDPLRK